MRDNFVDLWQNAADIATAYNNIFVFQLCFWIKQNIPLEAMKHRNTLNCVRSQKPYIPTFLKWQENSEGLEKIWQSQLMLKALLKEILATHLLYIWNYI